MRLYVISGRDKWGYCIGVFGVYLFRHMAERLKSKLENTEPYKEDGDIFVVEPFILAWHII